MRREIRVFPNCLLILVLFISCSKTRTTPDDAVVRISIGLYSQEREGKVEEKLQTIFREKIMPAVKKLEGNLNYYVTIDKEKNAISNVSIWKSKEAAKQMNEMTEMKEMAKEFIELGVEFSEITNHEIIWQLPEN